MFTALSTVGAARPNAKLPFEPSAIRSRNVRTSRTFSQDFAGGAATEFSRFHRLRLRCKAKQYNRQIREETMARAPQYYLEGDELTASQFRRLSRVRKIASMVEWFFDNFEDPAEKTPHASSDGGYQYIWGGPYDASEELYSHFGDVATEELIQAAVDEVQRDGLFEWAPKHIGDDLPTEDEDLNGPGEDEDYNEPDDDTAGFQSGAF
ncbi:hypothetical protein ACIPSK_20395 [Rhizobium sp. LARHSG275]|uniref:hypothetical protein n=1 Tax=Rhizobium TaxID=379 RepID=UPI0013895BF6|nr:hypothetical protein [Rhizobium laguerreae]NDK47886.1 hypothetical protein [Rhizobium laguerreae]